MVNYGNGKIYKVVCSETGRVYVGSTTDTLSRRMTRHRALTNGCVTRDFIDGKIFLIEDFPCERKEQLLSRERFYIESMDCVNKKIPTRTLKEYLEKNKEKKE
jgi:predicted GIY-YIG superfamily endonuclease